MADTENLNKITNKLIERSRILCKKCGQPRNDVGNACIYCAALENEPGKILKIIKLMDINLTETEKWTVALNNFLLFTENHLDVSDNDKLMEELIFVSVNIINNVIDKDELPNPDLKEYWKNLLRKTHYFGSSKLKCAVTINNDEVDMEVTPEVTPEGKNGYNESWF